MVPVAGPLLQVLAQTDLALRMGPAELSKEIGRLSEAEDASADNTLVLAHALAQMRQPADTARALGLVQRVLANSTAAAQTLHPLARLLEARVLQQRRLEEQLERQAQQLRDLQRRNDQLSERLEAVRAIERSLTTRPPLPASAPGSSPRPAP
jgi:DNA repair ATPase RecN